MIACIVAVEILICLLWEFALQSPTVTRALQSDGAKRMMTCSYGENTFGLVIWSIYNAGKHVSVSYD